MSANNETNTPQEVDLSDLSKGVASFFRSIELFIYRSIRFVISNIKMTCALVIIGAVIGFFFDKKAEDVYKHEIIIKTNFNSSAYLYKKIESYNIFYKKNKHDIRKIEITPIIDVVSFVSNTSRETNYVSVAKYLSENNISLDRYKEDDPNDQTSRIYNYHILTLYTCKEDVNNEIINNFLAEINDNHYFIEKQKIVLKERQQKINEHQTTIKYINAYLEKVSSPDNVSDKNVSIEIGSRLSDMLEQKHRLQSELESLYFSDLEVRKTFFDISILPNIVNEPLVKKIILFPVLFVLGYFCVVISILRYKKYILITEK